MPDAQSQSVATPIYDVQQHTLFMTQKPKDDKPKPEKTESEKVLEHAFEVSSQACSIS